MMNTNKSRVANNTKKNPDQIRHELEARVAALKGNPVEPEIVETVALRETVVDHIFQVMQEQNISQAELARRLGKSRAYVCKILGGANLTLDSLAALGEALGRRLEIRFEQDKSTPATAALQTGHTHSLSGWEVKRPALEIITGGIAPRRYAGQKAPIASGEALFNRERFGTVDSKTNLLKGSTAAKVPGPEESISCEILQAVAA